jgi:FtsZ-binding cell division protein ZapB
MVIRPEPQTFALIPVKIPVIPEIGDKFILEIDALEDLEIGIYGFDGLTWQEVELARRAVTRGLQLIECALTESPPLDRCGFPVYIYAYGPVILRSLDYIPQGPRAGRIPRSEFGLLEPGHSVIRRRSGPYWVSWGFFTGTGGSVPVTLSPAERYPIKDAWPGLDALPPIVEEGLSYLLSNLHKKVAQLLATRQELQSAWQELQAARQDLQAAREELQIARQELQSTRQELFEVNHQLEFRTGIKGAMKELWRSMRSKMPGNSR